MKCSNCERCPMALVLRWTGRILGLAIVALVAWFSIAHVIAGEGPNPFAMSASELGLAVTLLGAVAGMMIGWRREQVGGILIVGSMILFFAIDRFATGSWPRGWVLSSFLVPGILYLAASCFEACRARHLKVMT